VTVTVKGVVYFAGLMIGAVVAAYLASHRGIGGTAHSVQDALLWMFGLGLIGACVWRIARGVSRADWHMPIWFALGAFILYGEIFNVATMKEFACQAFLQGRGHHSRPCYNP
jgi:prolipoprotein diacylglyceryltransferase